MREFELSATAEGKHIRNVGVQDYGDTLTSSLRGKWNWKLKLEMRERVGKLDT